MVTGKNTLYHKFLITKSQDDKGRYDESKRATRTIINIAKNLYVSVQKHGDL